MPAQSPFREVDDTARALAQDLIRHSTFAALAATDPDTGHPTVSRIAFATTPSARFLSLVSDLSHHTRALRANPNCALLLGEPGPKGDPLTHPRLTLHATADFVTRDNATFPALREQYLQTHPKAGLYIDFTDFNFVRFTPKAADLNGGFGKAFHLSAQDLLCAP